MSSAASSSNTTPHNETVTKAIDSIETLLEQRYSFDEKEARTQLEKFVDVQVTNTFYHHEANLALLKLYQYEPSTFQTNIVQNILILAMMQLPSTHFLQCTYLLPSEKDASLTAILTLQTLLESAQFEKFWSTVDHDMVKHIPSFETSIQKYIIRTLSITFQKIRCDQFSKAVNVTDQSALSALVEANSLTKNDDFINFPANEDNQQGPTKLVENVRWEQIVGTIC
eukprot:CAMPEP_0201544540 /NCGR_PEP_ID=MMETSP0173_2-20130828/1174_1 /ASSEMBLY_ACC=CAM_ASM_000268 /TAXON_ID=218659 /ORGANISM="Vexillifera sp., Strain DIVA3 564/2" /LENGTH=225 /DNA_ID=CAMNT_0047952695 /DNA_START=27 /DNA_END=704 /DNA_ORIENTATION=+